jgi:hypothetical protein
MLRVLYKPVRWNAAEASVILQEFLSIGWRYVFQNVGSNNCLEGAVREGKLGSRANDWVKCHLPAHNPRAVAGNRARPSEYGKVGQDAKDEPLSATLAMS